MFSAFFRPKLFEDPIADPVKMMAAFPRGTILPYVGRLENIPAGWQLCNGTNGTVNLVDYIPYGAGSNAQVEAALNGQHEGKAEHQHANPSTATPQGNVNTNVRQEGGSPLSVFGTDHTHTLGATHPAPNLPPVTRMFFIQKIR